MEARRPEEPAPAWAFSQLALRTPTLPPATHTNSYALGEREVLLVEPATPYPEERRRFVEWARAFASQGRTLAGLLITHHHPDHVGGAQFLAEALGLPLWAHAASRHTLPDLHIARTLADGEALLLDGPTPQRWDVLHTPGHASDHLCLHERSRGLLVVGDMLTSIGTVLIPPDDGDMAEYLRQLQRLDALGARQALPAHGPPIDDPHAMFTHYVAHRLAREARIVTALGQGAADLDTLLARSYADVAEAVRPLARLSLRAHLDKLVAEGRVALHETLYRLEP